MKEIPQYICRTSQLQADIALYNEAPRYEHGHRLSFWQAKPEMVYYRDLEALICDQKVFRMNTLCDSCNKRQYAWWKEYTAEKRMRALANKAPEPPKEERYGRRG